MSKKELTGQPNLMKEVNRGLIKTALQRLHMATRVELSLETKISQPTVNTIVNELLAEEVVIESGKAESSGGRKAVLYSLNTKIWSVLSVLVEKRDLHYAVTDLNSEVIDEGHFKRKSLWSAESLTEKIAELVSRNKSIRALSVGVPGSVSKEGVVSAIPRVACLEGFSLKQRLEERFGLTVSVRNDINTIALGYYTARKIKDQDIACIHMGETLGAAMIIGGHVVNGAGNFAGEIGFMQVGTKLRSKELRLFELSEKQAVLTVSKIMINLICLVNPAILLMSGYMPTAEQKKAVLENCAATVPEGILPEIIFLGDERAFYMKGLAQAGIDSMNSQVRLIR
ncbi:MAG: ROK family protein [Lachnospiraceae bacterium]|nr:ROK family protein [Lachnospiraceae bacterium]